MKLKSLMSEPKYKWYTKVNSSEVLKQGDIFLDCPLIGSKEDINESDKEYEAVVYKYDIIVLSQSCDLISDKINLVLVCPFYPLEELSKKNPDYKKEQTRKQLKKGEIIGRHLLYKCKIRASEDFLVVDFKSPYSIPINVLKNIAFKTKTRIRLLPPYREHLSQAFSRFVMRVGLPIDISDSELFCKD